MLPSRFRRANPRAACAVVLVGVVALGLTVLAAPKKPKPHTDPALGPKLAALGERIQVYRDRISSISVTETVTQRRLNTKMAPFGKPKTFVYDVTITRVPNKEGPDTVRAERELKLVDGKPPRKRDLPECTDPQSAYDDPLSFLLPDSQSSFAFTVPGADGGGATLAFEQLEADRVEVTPKMDACFSVGGGRSKGRVWIDPDTSDPMRVETHLAEPFPVFYERLKDANGSYMVFDRVDGTVKLAHIPFQDPEETLLLPESIVSQYEIRGAATPRLRTEQVFTNYKRFLTEAKIKGNHE